MTESGFGGEQNSVHVYMYVMLVDVQWKMIDMFSLISFYHLQ